MKFPPPRLVDPAAHRRLIAGWLAAIGASLLVLLSPLSGTVDRALLDRQFVALRALAPQSAALDPVIVGIDESSLAAAPEPLAFAAWLDQQDLRDEARRYWAAIAAERGEDPRLRTLASE